MTREEIKRQVTKDTLLSARKNTGRGFVPVGISNRHVHLTQAAVELLFGPGHQLTPMKALSQPGQFACEEKVMVEGPKGKLNGVRERRERTSVYEALKEDEQQLRESILRAAQAFRAESPAHGD